MNSYFENEQNDGFQEDQRGGGSDYDELFCREEGFLFSYIDYYPIPTEKSETNEPVLFNFNKF